MTFPGLSFQPVSVGIYWNLMDHENLRSGERRNVTVIFSDMKGFTSLSEKMDPEEVDALMNNVFSVFEKTIRKYGGVVEKYIGDALVAVFGAQRVHEDDPARAINSALDFLEEIGVMNRTILGKGVEIKFRTGVHSGLITTGRRGDYDVVSGHSMSVASRLQENAPANAVLVSAATREKCESDFLFSDRLTIKVKGKSEPIEAFRVLGRNTDPLHYTGPFAGREQTLKDMLKSYLKADPARAEGFVILGEPGIGKTRLVAQFISKLKSLPDYASPVLYARAKRYRSLRFSIINDLLFNYLRIDQFSPTVDIERALESKTGIPSELASRLAVMVSEEEQQQSFDSSSFMIHFTVLERIIEKYSEDPYSVILFIDNVQDLDAESREFLGFFSRKAKNHPFIVLAGRGVDHEFLALFPQFEIIRLKPLRPEESSRLIEELWPEGSEAAKTTIASTTEGNPLFIEEYVKFAKENRDISSVPMTVQNIFLSAFDKYDTDQQELLKKLSVFIHSFTLDDARYINRKTSGTIEDVKEVLAYFIGEGIIVQENNLYSFKHDLVKQALYNSLLNYNKKILHRLVANLLFKQKTPNMMRLVHHLARAEDWRTLERTIFEDPSHLQRMEYLRFVELLQQRTDRQDTSKLFTYLFTKAAILFNNGKTEGAETILQEIMRMAVSEKRPEFSARAYHLLTAHYAKAHCFQKTLFCGERAVYFYRRSNPESPAIQNVYNDVALSLLFSGDLSGNQRLIDRMEHTGTNGSYDMKLTSMAERAFYLGEYGKAEEIVTAAIPQEKAPTNESWILGTVLLVRILHQRFDFERLRPKILDLLEVFSQDYATLTDLYAYLAEGSHLLGESEKVASYLKQAEYYATQSQIDFSQLNSLRSLAMALYLAGDLEAAERFACKGLELGLRHSIYYPTFTLLVLMAEIYDRHGARDDARYLLADASFFVGSGALLSRQDLIMYHYLGYKLNRGDTDATQKSLSTAAGLLELEIESIDDERLAARFLSARRFAKVREEAASTKVTVTPHLDI